MCEENKKVLNKYIIKVVEKIILWMSYLLNVKIYCSFCYIRYLRKYWYWVFIELWMWNCIILLYKNDVNNFRGILIVSYKYSKYDDFKMG